MTGSVATDLDEPIAGRAVVLVDARGARHEIATDGDGGFTVSGVVPPYDLAVAPASSGPMTVHLGIQRRDPYVELFERDGPTPTAASQRIRVGVRWPACDLRSCSVVAMTSSPSGGGSSTTACAPGEQVTAIDVDHRWRGHTVRPGEQIDVHVLVSDVDRSFFAHAHVDGVAAAPGDTVDVGVLQPASVAASEAIPIVAEGGAAALPDWRWSTTVFLDVSGEGRAPDPASLLMVAADAGATVRAPLIAGAKLFASITAVHPRSDAQGGFHRSSEAWSGARTPSVAPITLDVAAGPEMVRPGSTGSLSRRGLGFEWTSSSGLALSTLTVADTARGRVRFRVLTTGSEVPLARLSELGLPKLDVGDHVLDLSTSAGVGADDAVSPDAAVRRRRFDRTRPGAASHLRVPFQVTS